ncbi:MAG: pyruvate kinase [Nitrospirae bacterium]|nr:pyruvate kinase [Nitrospirota bacterium]
MKLPVNKTKIVCTMGPASESVEIIKQMVYAGMNIARLNFSHGDLNSHEKIILNLRSAAKATGRRIAIIADLPGPKMRIGQFIKEPIDLKPNDIFTLTTKEIIGDESKVSVTFAGITKVLKKEDMIFLNDGLIQLEVIKVQNKDVVCRVVVGGELRSRNGLNLPGAELGIIAFTERDHEYLKFAMRHDIDAVSQSFVESGRDILEVRKAANEIGYNPFIIAKIERLKALEYIDEILENSDGIMIARGDLGVEIPIEKIAIVQKQLMYKANLLGKPVITATQMLESMTRNRRPTRAEATDVANAILDGTDCVMLSGESAMGKYPVEAVDMLSKIASATEPYLRKHHIREELKAFKSDKVSLTELIALGIETTVERISPSAVFVPTHSGATARNITRFRIPVWIVAISSQETTCQRLQFSYGVYPVHEPEHPEDWNAYVKKWLYENEVEGNIVLLTEGPSTKHPEVNNRLEIIDLNRKI